VRPTALGTRNLWIFVRWFVTFNLVSLGLLLFRAESTSDAWIYVVRLVTGSYAGGLPPVESMLVLFSLGLHFGERWLRNCRPRLQRWVDEVWWARILEGVALGVIAALTIAAMGSGGEFIYFQF
jgi:hypothetical protein